MVSKVPNAEIAPFSTEAKTRHFGIHNSTSTTKNLVLLAFKTNAKTCKFDKEMFLWILELCLCMTDGARQVSFQSKLLSTLIFFYRQNMNKNVLPTSRRNFWRALKKENKKLPSTKPENCTFTVLEPKTVFQLSSSAFEPFKHTLRRKPRRAFGEKKASKAKSKNFPSLRSTRLRLGKPTRRTIATEGQAI